MAKRSIVNEPKTIRSYNLISNLNPFSLSGVDVSPQNYVDRAIPPFDASIEKYYRQLNYDALIDFLR